MNLADLYRLPYWLPELKSWSNSAEVQACLHHYIKVTEFLQHVRKRFYTLNILR